MRSDYRLELCNDTPGNSYSVPWKIQDVSAYPDTTCFFETPVSAISIAAFAQSRITLHSLYSPLAHVACPDVHIMPVTNRWSCCIYLVNFRQ